MPTSTSPLLLLLLFLTLLIATATSSSDLKSNTQCYPQGSTISNAQLCIQGSARGPEVALTVYSAADGWAYVGSAETSVVAWKNEEGKVVVQSHTTLRKDSESNGRGAWRQVEINTDRVPAWSKLSFSVARSYLDQDGMPLPVGAASYAWAFSNNPPVTKDKPQPQLVRFGTPSAEGVFEIQFGGGRQLLEAFIEENRITADAPKISPVVVNLVHGTSMFIAWGVAPFPAIFIARYLKDYFGVWWFRLHALLMMGVCGGFTLLGFAFKVANKPAPHFVSLHARVGLSIVIATFLQNILGIVIDKLWTPDRTEIPIWDKIHWVLGRLLVCFGIMNIFGGFIRYNEVMPSPAPTSLAVLMGLVVLGGVGLMVYGEKVIGAVHHVGHRFQAIPDEEDDHEE
ncbi:hypothetical protein HDV05_004882 [Chytridiales sp. JEL 0842]|nr:hypothetical protein HDV05_004882 [Chytridiales sp. JEL 0842]